MSLRCLSVTSFIGTTPAIVHPTQKPPRALTPAENAPRLVDRGPCSGYLRMLTTEGGIPTCYRDPPLIRFGRKAYQ
jgi:hypothetical protein